MHLIVRTLKAASMVMAVAILSFGRASLAADGERWNPKRWAVIIAGRGGDEILGDSIAQYVSQTAELLLSAKFDPNAISVFSEAPAPKKLRHGEITRKAVLAELSSLAEVVEADDEVWVFVFGHANVNRRGLSLFTRGRRLRGKELADGLTRVGGRQVVFCLNRQSAALMPLLSTKNRAVMTATDNPQQLNMPKLAEHLLQWWSENPNASLLEVIRQSGQLTQEYYVSRSLAYAEQAQAFDGVRRESIPLAKMSTGRLSRLYLSPPAGKMNNWALFPTTQTAPATRPKAADETNETDTSTSQPSEKPPLL